MKLKFLKGECYANKILGSLHEYFTEIYFCSYDCLLKFAIKAKEERKPSFASKELLNKAKLSFASKELLDRAKRKTK